MSDQKEFADLPVAGQSKLGGRAALVLSRALKVLLILVAVMYFAVAGIYLALRYVVMPQVDAFRPRIEQLVSSKIHAQMRIGRINAQWSGLEPTFDIDNLRIDALDGTPGLAVPHASATIAWHSLVHLAPVLSNLTVDGPDVMIARAADGSLSVAGVPIPARRNGNNAFLTWLLSQEAIVLRDGTLRWRDAKKDAPELTLKRIKLAVLNDGVRHRLSLQAPADGELLHGPLDFRADFTHQRFTVTGRWTNWTGHAFLSTGPVDLPMLARYVSVPFATYGGRFDNRIWIDFDSGKLQEAGGDLTGSDVSLRVRPSQPRLDMPIARFNWNLALKDDEYTLNLADVHAELGQKPLDDGTPMSRLLAMRTLTGRYRAPSVDHGQLLAVSGDYVDLGILSEFLRALPLPARVQNNLIRYSPRGQIANYTLESERPKPKSAADAEASSDANAQRELGPNETLRYTAKAELLGVSIQAQEPPPGLTIMNHPRAGIPGVENLWGTIDANQDHGTVVIDTKNTALTIPGVFDNPRLAFDQINGHIDWTLTDAPGKPHRAITVHVPTLRVKNADAQANATADYKNVGEGRGSLDLKANIAHMDLTHLVRYLPTSISEKFRTYLGHALQAGTGRDGTIEVHGDLTKFPYTRFPDAGHFKIVAPFKGGKFDPTPFPPRKMANGTPSFWPAFDGIDGTFQLAENKLRFDVTRGHYLGVAVKKTAGHIDDLGNRESKVMIDSLAYGPVTDMLDYVENSSLGVLSKHAATKIRATGDATLALHLEIPRVAPPPGVRPHVGYRGALTFNNNDLAYETFPPLSQLKGTVSFGEKTGSLDGLTGKLLGGDMRATGDIKPDGSYALHMSGRLGADAAQDLKVRDPEQIAKILKHISGTAPYDLLVRGVKTALPEIQVKSDLTGLGLDFPAPLHKQEGVPMPVAFTLSPVAESPDLHDAQLVFGPITAHYVLKRVDKNEPTIERGVIGVNKVADLPAQGVTANIEMKELDADAWRKLIADVGPMPQPAPTAQAGTGKPSETAKQFAPDQVNLHLARLTLLNRHWDDVVVRASRDPAQKWQANIASDRVSGDVDWTPGATRGSPGTVRGRFTKVAVPNKDESDLVGKVIGKQPRNMPTIDLVVDELLVRDHTLGRLEVDARNTVEDGAPVWHLDKLELANPDSTFEATGDWRTINGLDDPASDESPRRTALDFKLDILDAGALAERLGVHKTVQNGKGTLAGQLAWDGSPAAINFPTLNGQLTADLEHGQIIKVNPGAAKLLGVFSLPSLAHFLTLNFQDVVGKGLPFSKISGSAAIQNGIGRTNDFTMVTAPARVELTGLIDLPQKTEDLHARVIPTIGAGTVALGAAIVNPLLGLGTLVAEVVLSKSIGQAFARDYSITGPWSKPVVQRVKGDQGKIETPAAAVDN
jgi:uncharacterized protein (TIGR02099 family)